MSPLETLRTTVEDLFRPTLAYVYANPAQRNATDFMATLTLPLDLAAAGFACRVERTATGGYELTVTRPRLGTMPKITAVGSGPTWTACCVETRHQLREALDRIETDLVRLAARRDREALAA